MTRPKHTKPDTNQAPIMKELRARGFDVDDVHDLGGLYDMVVSGRKEQWIDGKGAVKRYAPVTCSVRVEVKSKKGLLGDKQIKYYELQRHPDSYIVAYSAEDVLEWFGG